MGRGGLMDMETDTQRDVGQRLMTATDTGQELRTGVTDHAILWLRGFWDLGCSERKPGESHAHRAPWSPGRGGGSHRTALGHQFWVVRPLVVICLFLLLHLKYTHVKTK